MDNFISTVIFTLPGLLCYYWLQFFGVTPAQKHNPFEMLGISALLWLPVASLTLLYYNLISLFEKMFASFFLKGVNIHFPFIKDLEGIKDALTNLWFVLFFIVSSIFFSYLFSRIWVEKIYVRLINHVNEVRTKKLKISAFSKKQTVWEELFINNDQKVVKIAKLDKPDEYIIGSIRKASRPLEPERNFALDEVDYFTKLVDKYNPLIKKVFIDTKAGIIVYIFDPLTIKEIQEVEHSSKDPIVSPWVSDSEFDFH